MSEVVETEKTAEAAGETKAAEAEFPDDANEDGDEAAPEAG